MDSTAAKDGLLDLPALKAPPGTQSNFVDPPSRPDLLLGILIPCLVVVVVMCLMRFYVKSFLVRKWHYEDYTLFAALLFQIGQFAPAFHAFRFAPVVHQWDVPIRNIGNFFLDFHVGAIFYDMTILTLKLSILLQFLRVFVPRGDRSFTFWMTHVVLWGNTLFYIIIVFLEIFACRPMAKLWDPLITNGKCLNTLLEYLISASFNFALDFIILVWTQKVIWSLQLSGKRKMKLGILFLAGFIACIFGALRVYMTVRLLRTQDKTYAAFLMAISSFPECTSGFLVLCLPVFPRFFNSTITKVFPGYPVFVLSLKAKVFSKTATAPHAHMANDENDGRVARRRSLWHISTIDATSKVVAEVDEESKSSERDVESA